MLITLTLFVYLFDLPSRRSVSKKLSFNVWALGRHDIVAGVVVDSSKFDSESACAPSPGKRGIFDMSSADKFYTHIWCENNKTE